MTNKTEAGGQIDSEKNDEEKRGNWAKPIEFILCCLGYAVGLGNVWRFPYMCYENGGGAFLIPYAIMLTFVGIPAFFMELIMGQYSAKGPLHVWEAVPIFKGIGIGMLFINSMFCIFYTMIIGYALYYLVLSFFNPLPWDTCHHPFNTAFCYNKKEAADCEELNNGTWFNNTCYDATDAIVANSTQKSVSSSEEYFNYGVLQMTTGIEHTGGIVWQLVCALGAGWIICFLCLLKGIKTTGKVVYFTALFPYVVLTIMLIYGLTLPGSYEGVIFYVKPDWSKLKSSKVWIDAASQIFFSLSVGGGGLMTFSSYNKFHNNVYRDALIVAIANCLTSFYAGFAIFSILGYMANVLGTKVPDVVTDGSTLAFVAYPTAMARMPVPQLWSVLFFVMLVTLGLDSLFAGVETNITAIVDNFPKVRRHKTWVTLAMCIVFFLLGLPMVTNAGVYWLNVIAYYATGWSLIMIGILETVVIAWIYGARHLREHVKEMCGFTIGVHWWFCWTFITPLLLMAIFVFAVKDFKPLAFGPYVFPSWAQTLGWLIALTPVVAVVIYGLVYIKNAPILYRPSKKWGPSLSKETGVHSGSLTDNRDNEYVSKPNMEMEDRAVRERDSVQGYANPSFSVHL